MKKIIFMFMVLLVSCTRVEPNYVGVLMTNYGQNGMSDYSIVKGTVNIAGAGTKLFQVPTYLQRGRFDSLLNLKASDNTSFVAKPVYSYLIEAEDAITVVFNNSRLDTEDFMLSVENNTIEPIVYDYIKELSRSRTTEDLMKEGGSLKFEKELEEKLTPLLKKQGITLKSFSTNLDFAIEVKERIAARNQVSQNIQVLKEKIAEQKLQNELAELKKQENIIISQGLTPAILQKMFIEKWDGKTPIYSTSPNFTKEIK